MALTDGGWLRTPKIHGRREGFSVMIQLVHRSYEVSIEGLAGIPQELSLHRLNPSAGSREPGILTGDTAFDLNVRVLGNEAKALALLDSDTRELVLRHIAHGWAAVDNGRLSCRHRELRQAGNAVPELLELARHLVIRCQDVPARLAANAHYDATEGVRFRSLLVLLSQFAEHEVTGEVCRKLLELTQQKLRNGMPCDRVELEAARALADQGLETVCDMALHATGDKLRLRAIEHLTRASWAEQVLPVLEQLLDDPSIPVLNAAINAIGRFRHQPAVAKLLALLRPRAPTTAVIVQALTRIADPRVEESLLPLLRSADLHVLTTTISALARLGSIRAVEPLLQLARTKRGLARRVEEAIERIQSRLPDAEPGQLSIATTSEHEGALSPADSAQGAVSLASEDDA
jgi:HEAT repeat protein